MRSILTDLKINKMYVRYLLHRLMQSVSNTVRNVAKFQVLKAANIKMALFWVVAS